MYEAMWHAITNRTGGNITAVTIPVMFGRSLEIPQSCSGVARFDFEYLCGRPVGAADYIAIAKNYHAIFITDLPAMIMKIRDKIRRFTTLIDELYNHHCRLIYLAVSSIDDLFQGTEEGPLFDLESFQFETEAEGTKLRRDVFAEGKVGVGPSAKGLVSMLSGQEEIFEERYLGLLKCRPRCISSASSISIPLPFISNSAPLFFAKDRTVSQPAPV